ncbi:hypothetical protein ACWD4B_16690 [Streptomyces sp. NPDC002536]
MAEQQIAGPYGTWHFLGSFLNVPGRQGAEVVDGEAPDAACIEKVRVGRRGWSLQLGRCAQRFSSAACLSGYSVRGFYEESGEPETLHLAAGSAAFDNVHVMVLCV